MGAVASFRTLVIVPRLPKTRSGKILRGLMRQLAEGKEIKTPPATIEDEHVIPELKEIMLKNGVVRKPVDEE